MDNYEKKEALEMAKKTLTERDVRRAIIMWLGRQGYNTNLKEKETHEHGVDIKVKHKDYGKYYLVEVKGDVDSTVKYPRSRVEVYFISALGQIVSRMDTANYNYALGFPISYKPKVMKRLPWMLCKRLKLRILLVDDNRKVNEITWKELRAQQRG